MKPRRTEAALLALACVVAFAAGFYFVRAYPRTFVSLMLGAPALRMLYVFNGRRS